MDVHKEHKGMTFDNLYRGCRICRSTTLPYIQSHMPYAVHEVRKGYVNIYNDIGERYTISRGS